MYLYNYLYRFEFYAIIQYMEQVLSIGKAANYLGVSIQTMRRWEERGQLISVRKTRKGKHRRYKLTDLEHYVRKSGVFHYAKKWTYHTDGFILLPFCYCANSSIFQGRLASFGQQLQQEENKDNKNLIPIIISIVGEIGNNSFDHNLGNWPDVPGTLFSYDMLKKEIILADRGQGIMKTLSRVRPELLSDAQALHLAFSEVVSGRAPEIRGNGLKYVRRAITGNEIHLFFQTGNAILKLKKNSEVLNIKESNKYARGCLVKINY